MRDLYAGKKALRLRVRVRSWTGSKGAKETQRIPPHWRGRHANGKGDAGNSEEALSARFARAYMKATTERANVNDVIARKKSSQANNVNAPPSAPGTAARLARILQQHG